MTAYVFTPSAPVPSPRAVITSSDSAGQYATGYMSISTWGAGIRAGTYPIRIIRIEPAGGTGGGTGGTANPPAAGTLPMYRVDNVTFNNSGFAPVKVPIALRQGAPTPTCTTGMSTTTQHANGNSQPYYTPAIQGAIPSGTMSYLGSAIAPNQYNFSTEVIIQPGSAFWIGSNVTPVLYQLGQPDKYVASNSIYVASTSYSTITRFESTVSTNIYFEEIQEDWFS